MSMTKSTPAATRGGVASAAPKTVSFLEIPSRKQYLTLTIGRRLRDRFARSGSEALPPIDFYTPQRARSLGLPSTGWFDFSDKRIGIVLDPARDAKREWIWATLVSVHEYLHWLFNFTPLLFDLAKPHEHRIWNILLDAGNEQRAILEDVWARRILVRGRCLILAEETRDWKQALHGSKPKTLSNPDEHAKGRLASWGHLAPIHEAGNLVLGAHTVLASEKKQRILRRLHAGTATSSQIWAALESALGPPSPQIAPQWGEAFDVACRAIVEQNEFVRADLVRAFVSLFPPPPPDQEPPDSRFDVGGHRGQGAGQSADGSTAPPGAQPLSDQKKQYSAGKQGKSSDRSQANEPGTGEPAASNKGGAGSDSEPGSKSEPGDKPEEAHPGAQNSGAQNSSPGKASPKQDKAEPDGGSPSEPDSAAAPDSGPLVLGPVTGDDDPSDDPSQSTADPEDDPEKVARETSELNREAQRWCPGGPCSGEADTARPAPAADLEKEALPYAAELATRLKISNRPRVLKRESRGRVIARVIARTPDAADPFKGLSGHQLKLGPQVYVTVTWDSSGSMKLGNKWQKARLACMSAHLAFQRERVPHAILLSRTLLQVAGEGVRPDHARCLIAGAAAQSDGDNYTATLPFVLTQVTKRKEPVKVVVCITDGAPNSRTRVKAIVDEARRTGVVVVGLGLDLDAAGVRGMEEIFGRDCVSTLAGKPEKPSFATLLGQVISAAVQRGKQHVALNN